MKKSAGQGKPQLPKNVEGSDRFNYGTDWLMAALLLAAAASAAWMMRSVLTLDFNARDFNPLIGIPLFLAAFGIKFLMSAVRGSLRGRRFGTSTLAVEGDYVHLGEKLTGVVRTPTRLAPTGDYQLTLRCIEQTREHELIDAAKYRTTDHVRWEARRRVVPATVDSSKGIPFAFDVPTVALANADTRAKGEIRWTLEITAPMSGVDYYEIFGVAVRPQR